MSEAKGAGFTAPKLAPGAWRANVAFCRIHPEPCDDLEEPWWRIPAAARLFEAARTGTTRLKVHFDLVGQGERVVASGDPSEESVVDWAKAARRVNNQTVRAVNGWIRLQH